MRQSAFTRLALLAALVAVVVIALVSGSDRGWPSAVAQSSTVGMAADCGSGNPLNGRTQGIVDAIITNLRNSGTLTASETCADVTNADLATITGNFALNYYGLTQLRAGDFQGMSGVGFLQLNYNDLTVLPENVFTGLTGVTRLWVQSNRLTTIEVGAFNGLSALQRLYLSNNKLTTLPATVFSGSSLTALRELYLEGNHLASLPSNILQGLSALQVIGVADNYLTSDQLGFLAVPISTLTSITLSGNLLTSDGDGPDPDLPTNIFGIHPMLHSINLNDNRLTELPTGVFSGMRNARAIRVRDNRIARLQTGVFQGVTWFSSLFSGGTIQFSQNLIKSVDAGVFNGGACEPPATPGPSDPTNCVLTLWLDYNQIESLPAGLFSGMTRVRNLYLNGNKLTTVPADLYAGMSSMTLVRLHQNLIETLPDSLWQDLQNLSRVDLHDNRLTTIPASVFNGLPTIASGPNMGKPSRPATLNIYDNPISTAGQAALTATLPNAAIRFTNPISVTPRVLPPDDGMREDTANCGTGHTLTGRTLDIVWLIMRGAHVAPDKWPAAVASNPSPALQSTWPFSASAWQTRHGTTVNPGDPPAIEPALCNLMTADDLTRVTSLTIPSTLNLNANDFAGLTNLGYLAFGYSWSPTKVREWPAGLFDGLTNLRRLEMVSAQLTALPAGIFDDLTNLETLNLTNNLLTTLPDGVLDNTRNLRTLQLGQNRLDSLPAGVFRNLGELRTLNLQINNLDADDFPVGIFNGMSNLRTLTLQANNFRTLFLDVFADQMLDRLKLLRIGLPTPDRSTTTEFAAYRERLPSLTRLDRLTGAQIIAATPTPVPPTPTATATPTFHERLQLPIVSKIVPVVREFTIAAGDEVRLSFEMYNVQDRLDNDLFMHDSLRIEWTDSGAGTFTESTGAGADRDGRIDDREVVWRAPQLPGRHTVTANILPDWACKGSATECAAVFTVTVVRAAASATPEPTPCPTSGTVPTSITDADGGAYTAITPAEGGEFVGDGVTVTAPRGAVPGCDYIGLRAYVMADDTASMPARYGNWTVGGARYAVDAASSAGVKLANMVTQRPVDVCVPLPDEFRASLTGLTLLREIGGSVQELTSKVRRDAALGYMLCGAVSEFPAVVVAASRGEFGNGMARPTPTPEAETPDAGGAVPPSTAYVLLALVLGVLAVAVAWAGLTRIGRIKAG